MKRIRKNTVFLIVLVILYISTLFSCSPQKRLDRLIKNHPELKNTEYIHFRDTIYIREFTADTAFISKFDTVILDNKRLTVMVVNHDSLIYLKATAKADTIFQDKYIPYEKIKVVVQEKKSSCFKIFFCGFLSSVFLYGLIRIVFSIIRPKL